MDWKDFFYIVPEIFIFVSSLILLIAGIILNRKVIQVVSLLCVIITFILIILYTGTDSVLLFGSLLKTSLYICIAKLIIIGVGVLILLILFASKKYDYCYEFSLIIMLALFGMVNLIAANDFISFYLSFEIQSVSLYILACFNKESGRSAEAGIKYFVLSALSSCIMLYGISMVYGYTGSTGFIEITKFLHDNTSSVPVGVTLGIVLILVSMCFKLSAAPFHMWAPDVYQGAPTIVTAFFATVPKATFVLLLIRILNEMFIDSIVSWQQILVCASVLSVLISCVAAIYQSNLKRLFAYASIGHVGFMLAAIAVGGLQSVQSAMIYLIIYLSMNIGLFAFLVKLDDEDCNVSSLVGLQQKSPFTAFCLSIMMLSMAGIPPLAGFFSKFYVLFSLINSGFIILSIILIMTSVVSCYYYLRIIKVMYFDRPYGESKVILDGRGLSIILAITTFINISVFLYIRQIKEIIDYCYKFYFF